MLDKKYKDILEKIEFAYQPIVNIKTGKTYGVEVLLRNYKEAGDFYSIQNFFDEAFGDGLLYQVDLELRNKALKEFKNIDIQNLRMFYNIDYRIINMPDFTLGNTNEIFSSLNLDKTLIYFEISEKSTIKEPNALRNLCTRYKQEGFNVVIDNFATGISGFQLLYYPNCDFIKLDRMFIQNIAKDKKKKLFFSSIINMAHSMNIKVIASCIESIDEYYVCKDLGADFIQGYFIEKPSKKYTKIKSIYTKIKELYKNDKRNDSSNTISKENILKIKSLNINSSLEELFKYFRINTENSFAPIVDNFNNLIGAIYEKDIKKMSYSQYGLSLAKNIGIESDIELHTRSVISAEITWSVDKILDIYNLSQYDKKGIFITKNNEYYGFVDLNTLLELSYQRNIQIAIDKNPLTKLYGNSQIEKYITKAFEESVEKTHYIVYFDFNDFKPFNDSYGFRQGDRAIMMFADILKKYFTKDDTFIGHIGGDDFFVGMSGMSCEYVYKQILNIQDQFSFEASSLYNKTDRQNRYIVTNDRFNNERKFPLLGVASAIVAINTDVTKKDFDEILYSVKKSSKASKTPVMISMLNNKWNMKN
ncbi:MAG: GGDEF domain-containing protein [Campylobacterales bacterium]|nr:GGDEF domain-containing protein [Campylobacterales bacterium]